MESVLSDIGGRRRRRCGDGRGWPPSSMMWVRRDADGDGVVFLRSSAVRGAANLRRRRHAFSGIQSYRNLR